jgi:hypothetical protein
MVSLFMAWVDRIRAGFQPKPCACQLGWVGYGLHGLVNRYAVYWIGLGIVFAGWFTVQR